MSSGEETSSKQQIITYYHDLLYEKNIVGKPDFLALTVDNFFSKEDCQNLIDLTEQKGYEKALVNVGFGRQKLMKDVRDSDRCIIDSVELADQFWQKVKCYVPNSFEGHEVVGVNERMRFLRYDKGHYFKPHFDGSYVRPDGEEMSHVTFFLFLNEDCKGGESTFISPSNEKVRVEIIPKTGRLLIFQHNIYHEGSVLKKGRKYALRTDIMYRRVKK